MATTRAIINLGIFRDNIRLLRNYIGPEPMMCLAVKADAYGHGAIEISKEAIANGVAWLAVATPEEAVELRSAGITCPILLLCPATPESADKLVSSDISCTVSDDTQVSIFAMAAERVKKRASLHLEIDTGMGRTGCTPASANKIAESIGKNEHLVLEGICTHFADADGNQLYTRKQQHLFETTVAEINTQNRAPIIHASNSAGILNCSTARYDMVRPGIAAYGYPPAGDELKVKPVMEFVTKVTFLKTVPGNTGISYGVTYTTPEETIIATVGAGYADGYSRLLSNKGEVCIRNKRYRVCGRICMDQFMIDAGRNAHIDVYDDVTLFGGAAPAPSAAEVAGWLDTIPYEVVCNVSKRVVREYRR